MISILAYEEVFAGILVYWIIREACCDIGRICFGNRLGCNNVRFLVYIFSAGI